MSRFQQNRPGGRPPGNQEQRYEVFFDPAKPEKEIYDTLAESQADQFRDNAISSSQLRRFFGEVKELYRQLEARCASDPSEANQQREYASMIEPRFKMLRSKVYYSQKMGQSKIPDAFAEFLKVSIKKVSNYADFRKFVLHFEAVVGFIYGKDYVRR